MTRTVMCRKYQREMEGLAQPPFPGARGQKIFDSVSKQAWQEWLAHQTMLVNEKRLNLMDRTTRAFLEEEMEKFFSNQEVARAEGYVPPRA
ncbi:MAG: oxidative damage protection protein [Gammaproteobacteria bacterium]|nr:oxidative damage protection protein [Gammaproteobacteria bacterium]